jgi:phage host-nuclease inhibitor protein Gam
VRKHVLEKVMKQTDEQNVQMAESYLDIAERSAKRALDLKSEIEPLLQKIEEYKKVAKQFGDMANDCYEAMILKKGSESK